MTVKKNESTATDVAVYSSAMPSFLQGKNSERGSEGVTSKDVIIPRLELVQSLSPARDKKSDQYISGAEEGMIYNNITRELYGESAMVVPVAFSKEWLVWKDRKAEGGGAGGFRGAYPSEESANDFINSVDEPNLVNTETNQHFVLVIHADGRTEEAVVSCSKTKLKISKKWNSLIRMNGGDSFSRVYRLGASQEKNAKGDAYYNLTIAPLGFVTEEVYKAAEALHEQVRSGAVVADRGEGSDEPVAQPVPGKTEY